MRKRCYVFNVEPISGIKRLITLNVPPNEVVPNIAVVGRTRLAINDNFLSCSIASMGTEFVIPSPSLPSVTAIIASGSLFFGREDRCNVRQD